MRPVPQHRSSTARTSAASLLHSSWRWAAQRSWQPSTTISSYTPASREYGSAPFPPVVLRSRGSWPWPMRTPPTPGSLRNVASPMGADDICSHLASCVQRPQTQPVGDDEEVRQSAGLLRRSPPRPRPPSRGDEPGAPPPFTPQNRSPQWGPRPFWAIGGTRAGDELGQAHPWSAASEGRRCQASEVPRRTLSRLGGV